MMAHVAEAAEQRGRVVLRLSCTQPSRIAIEAAVRIAQAFHSEIESVFVAEPDVFDVAAFPFAREVSLTGRHTRQLSPEIMTRQMRQVAEAMTQRVAALARLAEVPSRSTIVRDEPLRAMAQVCEACGPWNVIALADCVLPRSGDVIRQLFEHVVDTTGIVITGPKARTTQGAVIVVVEDAGHLEPMLRAARRLVPPESGERVQILLVADNVAQLGELEGQVRLALGLDADVDLLRAAPVHGSAHGVAEALRRLRGGFVIGQFGGRLVPLTGDLGHLAATLECPLLVVR
ncbi:MAG: hypothetical protein ACKVP7_16645 [Hyphomicrobiaceae bacterium]